MVATRVTDEFRQQAGALLRQGLLMTRLTPPPQQTRLLSRQRMTTLLSACADYPLTLLIAPAGSGKTTALADFAVSGGWPIAWCRMVADDSPASLVRHLTAAFGTVVPVHEELIYAALEQAAEPASAASVQAALDTLVNELVVHLNDDTFLILDNYYLADQHPELRAVIERLLTVQPAQLHLLLWSRYEPILRVLATVRARGEVCQLGQADLAFTVEDSQALFALYDRLPPTDVAELTATCRGWPLALQALAADQSVSQETADEDDATGEEYTLSATAHVQHMIQTDGFVHADVMYLRGMQRLVPLLDEYLRQQVLDEQSSDLQLFLLLTSRLRWLEAGLCAALPRLTDFPALQGEVERRCLFLELTQRGQIAYQPLFKAFLERQSVQRLKPDDLRALHFSAADYYQKQADREGMIYHLLAIGEEERAADALADVARDWLSQGRAAALLTWLERLPEEQRRRPVLLEVLASASHRLGYFEQALRMYQQAEQAFQEQGDQSGQIRMLRGRAEVYLDTVQPAPAVTLLKQILKLLPPDSYAERAEILRLQAENWANRGRADVALKLANSANRLVRQKQGVTDESGTELSFPASPDPRASVPSPATSISPRLLLRSGRLDESRKLLEGLLGLEPQDLPDQRVTTFVAHREPLLLLALIYAMLGNGARALAMARRGLLESQQSGSPLTEAIAHMRTAHAYQVIAPLDMAAAGQHYREALALAQTTGVTRAKAEIYLGLTLLQGHSGDLGAAEVAAREGLHMAETAGDEWTAALIWLALGGAAASMNDRQSLGWLEQAQQRFTRGGDSYGRAVVMLWRALWHLHAGENEPATRQVDELLHMVKQHSYVGLLVALTLFGPRDMAMLVPLLLRARTLKEHSDFAQQLLRQAFPSIAGDEAVDDYHPGYTLRVQMLGNFRVWRGRHEIQAREWQREKARQLFQLLLTYRGRWLQREQICAWLWPDSDLDAAERQFKVTLNALNAALEPLRPPRTAPFFIRRQGLAYSFAPSYGCWIDVDEFELRTSGILQTDVEFAVRNSQIAVQIYRGDYLAESLYDPWTLEERERLLARFLATATMLATRLVDMGDTEQAVHMCELVLKRDRCYEEAYQVLMRAYARGGSRSQAMRSYARCVQALNDDLGIEPLPETTNLFEQVKRNEKI